MSLLNETLLTIALALVVITLPLLALAALQQIRLNLARLKSETTASERDAVFQAVKTAVAAAEQSGLVNDLIGPEKKERALAMAEDFLRKQGVELDLTQLSNYIEAEVLSYSKTGGPAPTAAVSDDRESLILNAVETAVMAAEQSGSKGLIQNIGTEKKAYATNLAQQFLDANGIQVDAELIGGLIEGELMKLFLAARGQLPTGSG